MGYYYDNKCVKLFKNEPILKYLEYLDPNVCISYIFEQYEFSNNTNLYSGRTNFILPCSSKNSTTFAYISCHLQRTHNRKNLSTRDLPAAWNIEKTKEEIKIHPQDEQ